MLTSSSGTFSTDGVDTHTLHTQDTHTQGGGGRDADRELESSSYMIVFLRIELIVTHGSECLKKECLGFD